MNNARFLAPLSLLLAIALFVATYPFKHIFAFALLHAFAEASMIGGLADWFAVVALFRHPLGIPIPHTGIIPKHRSKLTAGIIDMVQNTWLNKETIQERIRNRVLVPSLLKMLDDPVHWSALRKVVRKLLREMTSGLDAKKIAQQLLALAAQRTSTKDVTVWLHKGGDYAMQHGWHSLVLERGLVKVNAWLSSERVQSMIADNLRKVAEDYSTSAFRRLGKWMAENTNTLNYDELSLSIVTTLQQDIKAIINRTEHPARAEFETWLRTFLDKLDDNTDLHALLNAWRKDFFEQENAVLAFASQIEKLLSWIVEDDERHDPILLNSIDHFLKDALVRFRENTVSQETTEQWVKKRIVALVDAYHDEIGMLVRSNLEKLDDNQIVSQIEAKVGGDLQYIRLNGAIVGGSVGALLFLITYFL